jgi:hypothetical protein
MPHAASHATPRVSGINTMRLWPRAVDDRGKAFAFDPSAVLSWKERAARQGAAPLVLFFFAGVAVFVVHAGVRPMVPGPWRWLVTIPMLALLFYAGSLAIRVREIALHDRVARRRGVCAACGYSLCELEPQDDGCRVCPECGCAWKLA